MIEKLKFRAFRAINEHDTCLRYKAGHVDVLKDYGITNVTSNNDEWMHNPNIYCVIAEIADTGELIGGIRVQISDEKNLLPVEKAIGKMDDRIHKIVVDYRLDGGVGELCALWNAKSVAGLGISVLLTRAGISITNQLHFNTLIGICGDYTLNMFQRVGFVVDNSLGINGEFPYPKPDFIARVLGIMNASTLDTAHEYDKERMKTLRNIPVQIAIEKGVIDDIEVNYNLIVSK